MKFLLALALLLLFIFVFNLTPIPSRAFSLPSNCWHSIEIAMGLQNGIMLTERSKPEDTPTRKEGTAQDKEDMWRVGRDQELNVRKALDPYGLALSSHAINHNNTAAEKFPVPVRSWLHSSAYVHLGSCSLVRQN